MRRGNLVVVLFFAALWAPLAGMWFGWGRFYSGDENRRLAELPRFNDGFKSWVDAPERYNRYFQDHFGLRGALIKLQAIAKVKLLGVSPSSSVIVGKHGWLFYTGDRSLESYRRSRPFTDTELQQWLRIFESRRDWLAARHVGFLVLFAPDKHTIYPEYLPDGIRRLEGPSRLEQLSAALAKMPGVGWVDARSVLLPAKASYSSLYHLTDTHWNGFGMYITYREVVCQLAKTYPFMKPVPFDHILQINEFASGDLALMLGLKGTLREHLWHVYPRNPLQASHSPSGSLLVVEQTANLPRLVLLGDSFGIELLTCIGTHFSRTAFQQGYDFQPELIASERPDVVIVEMAERRLNLAPPSDPFETMHALNRMPGMATTACRPDPASFSAPALDPPFGAIDTPPQNAIVSGTKYVDFAWMLTPQPKVIPFDGSSISVVIDGKDLGHPVYGQFRPDLLKAFPDMKNSRACAGSFVIDTTKLPNGRHTILWRATDSASDTGETESRTFYVQN